MGAGQGKTKRVQSLIKTKQKLKERIEVAERKATDLEEHLAREKRGTEIANIQAEYWKHRGKGE